jgi:hypothetical protein
VLVSDAPFLHIREFNTTYMLHGGSSSRAMSDLLYSSQYKKQLRNLLDLYDEIELHNAASSNSSSSNKAVTSRQAFVYSAPDDCMDLVTFGAVGDNSSSSSGFRSSSSGTSMPISKRRAAY